MSKTPRKPSFKDRYTRDFRTNPDTSKPEPSKGFKFVEQDLAFGDVNINKDKLLENVLYTFPHNTWVSKDLAWNQGFYDKTREKIGGIDLQSIPYVLYEVRVPMPPSSPNKSFRREKWRPHAGGKNKTRKRKKGFDYQNRRQKSC